MLHQIVINIEFVHLSVKEDNFLYIFGERPKQVRDTTKFNKWKSEIHVIYVYIYGM